MYHNWKTVYKKQLVFMLSIATTFIVFTAIGAMTHEYAHFLAAKCYGLNPILYHDRVHCDFENIYDKFDGIVEKYNYEIQNNLDFKQKKEYQNYQNLIIESSLVITMSGPLQTMLFGSIGLVILQIRKIKWHLQEIKFIDWFAIFLSLFWSRQVMNLIISITNGIFLEGSNYFGGDEAEISSMLSLPSGTLSIATGIIGFIICYHIVFKIVPNDYRYSFIIAGLIGSASGFILWMYILGPLFFPL